MQRRNAGWLLILIFLIFIACGGGGDDSDSDKKTTHPIPRPTLEWTLVPVGEGKKDKGR